MSIRRAAANGVADPEPTDRRWFQSYSSVVFSSVYIGLRYFNLLNYVGGASARINVDHDCSQLIERLLICLNSGRILTAGLSPLGLEGVSHQQSLSFIEGIALSGSLFLERLCALVGAFRGTCLGILGYSWVFLGHIAPRMPLKCPQDPRTTLEASPRGAQKAHWNPTNIFMLLYRFTTITLLKIKFNVWKNIFSVSTWAVGMRAELKLCYATTTMTLRWQHGFIPARWHTRETDTTPTLWEEPS